MTATSAVGERAPVGLTTKVLYGLGAVARIARMRS